MDPNKDFVKPFITLVFLFFVVGFLTTANGQFQGPLKIAFLKNAGDLKNTFATLITFSWFLAYPLTGSVGSSWVAKFGYKKTLLRALYVMIAGLIIFFLSSWFTVEFPSSGLQISSVLLPSGFFIFLLGSFVVGASATILQVVINPYLSACYVKNTQPIQRLAMGGAANAIGNTIAPYFVAGVVFGTAAVEDVQVSQLMIPFLSQAAVIILVALIIAKLALPDVSGTRAESGEKLERNIWSFKHLALGVIAVFFYVGAEVCVGANINLYVLDQEQAGQVFTFFGSKSVYFLGINFSIPAFMATLYWGGTLIGRLTGSSLRKITPKTQLITTTVSALVLIGLAVIFNNPWLLVIVGLCHSIMWGAIFTLAVSRLGKYTSLATGIFMIGVIGGAILPLVQGILADVFQGWRWTWLMVIAGELYMLYYALIGSKVRNKDIMDNTSSTPLPTVEPL